MPFGLSFWNTPFSYTSTPKILAYFKYHPLSFLIFYHFLLANYYLTSPKIGNCYSLETSQTINLYFSHVLTSYLPSAHLVLPTKLWTKAQNPQSSEPAFPTIRSQLDDERLEPRRPSLPSLLCACCLFCLSYCSPVYYTIYSDTSTNVPFIPWRHLQRIKMFNWEKMSTSSHSDVRSI